MLVLSRKVGQWIAISEDVRVQVVSVNGPNGNQEVRLAFEAPPEIRIDRQEVRDKRAKGGGR